MNYNTIFDKYIFIQEKALINGFELIDGKYIIKKPLNENGFYAVFKITSYSLEINVYEEPDGEMYLPFNSSYDGIFVNTIRENVNKVLEDILKTCFTLSDAKVILLDYVQKKYGTIPEAPWDYLEEYHTLKTAKKQKWYGLFMLIPYKYLGIKKDGKIHVLNIKVKPENIPSLIDNIHYFPAYHMNKKYWISILLDREVDLENVKNLLDNSYAIVEGRNI